MEYYLAMKRNEVLRYATTWMTLGNITIRKEVSHKGHHLSDSICMKYPE